MRFIDGCLLVLTAVSVAGCGSGSGGSGGGGGGSTPITPIITWPTPASVTVGTALSSTQLDATTSVAGSFVYSPAAGTVMNTAGNTTLSVTFTPTDTVDYTTATGQTTLTVTSVQTAATDTVDFGTTYQTIRGFGGSEAWSGVMPQSQINTLYGNGTGNVGLTIMRLRIAPATWNSASNTADTTQWTAELTNGKAAQAQGAIVFATPWTPPPSMKSNNSVNEGSLSPSSYAAFASYLNAYANYAASMGVNLYALSMQNEPDYDPCGSGGPTASGCYESCLWTGAQMDTWVAGNASTLTTKLIMPESDSFNFNESDPTLNDPVAAPLVSIVGGHIYGVSPPYYPLAESLKKDVWMTEHTVNLASGETTTQSMADALSAAAEIHNSMVTGQYNAYVYWWLVNSTGLNYYSGLLDTTGSPTYFGDAIAQFSRFVRPGYQRANATATPVSGVYVSAYTGSGHYVIVAINANAATESVNFQISHASVSSMTPYQTTSGSPVAQQAAVSASANAFTYSLPAQSITTFVQ